MGLWRVNLCLGLKQFGAHVHAADGVPYILLKMSVRSLELAVGHFIGGAPKVTARQCRCPFTTCRLVLLQMLIFLQKRVWKIRGLSLYSCAIIFPKVCVCKRCLCCLCLFDSFCKSSLQISRAASVRCVFYTVILYWFWMRHCKLTCPEPWVTSLVNNTEIFMVF